MVGLNGRHLDDLTLRSSMLCVPARPSSAVSAKATVLDGETVDGYVKTLIGLEMENNLVMSRLLNVHSTSGWAPKDERNVGIYVCWG